MKLSTLPNPKPSRLSLLAGAALAVLCTGAAQAQTITANFAGLNLGNTFCGCQPPDTMGAIGNNQFVEFVNGGYAVFSRTGALTSSIISDTTFWLNAGVSSTLVNEGLSDPRIQFDPLSQRWFASEITLGSIQTATTNANNSVLLAVSKTANPLDGWTSTSINVAPL